MKNFDKIYFIIRICLHINDYIVIKSLYISEDKYRNVFPTFSLSFFRDVLVYVEKMNISTYKNYSCIFHLFQHFGNFFILLRSLDN